MTRELREKMVRARERFEDELGKALPLDFIEEVEEYCRRKIARIGRSEEYMPVLFECELRNLYQAKAITDFTLKIMKNEEEMERVYGM